MSFSLLPGSRDARILVATRSLRAFVDGIAFVALPAYLLALGFSGLQIGAVVTSSLLGSAILTLLTGAWTHRVPPRRLMMAGCALMVASGVATAWSETFVVLLLVVGIGTINASAGDVSPFLPLEQSVMAASVDDTGRTDAFARFNLAGSLAGSVGALCAGVPVTVASALGHDAQAGRRGGFLLYAAAGGAAWFAYRRLDRSADAVAGDSPGRLGPSSRRTVLRLAALFSLDSFGGGFATQAVFALWVYARFDLSTGQLGAVFFAAGILSAFSSLLSASIARRIGLVRTMVFTHVPASVLLILVALSPNAWVAMSLFVLRGLLSQMDVPVRTSYVMAVVQPHERAAAASITNVPRSLASALPPIAAGWMLDRTDVAWPLLICAACKILYDLLLLAMFANVRPPEESPGGRHASPK